MEDLLKAPSKTVLVNCDLHYADHIIEELDAAIQDTRNMQLSKTLNDILESYDAIRGLLTPPK